MKKTLLLAALSAATALSFAEEKTVTFDFSDPTKYGYEKAAPSAGTTIAYEGTIVSDGVTITNTYAESKATTFRFFTAADGSVTLRLASNGVFSLSAGGAKITNVTITGAELSSLTITPGTLSETTWTGEATELSFARTGSKTVQFATMAVTFEANDGGTTIEPTGLESFKTIENGKIASVFENAVADEGRSVVSFGTDNMAVEAVGGRTPKDVKLAKTANFTDWINGWNEPEWKSGNTNLHDNKPGVDTVLFYYVQGSGNPAVEIGVDEPTEKDDSLIYKPKYTFYSPDGSLGMPVMGLYYKFTPKVNGTVKAQIWANKGNRYTYVVKESAKTPIAYTKEGYVNGQNRTLENVTMKSLVNGADSIGSMNEKILLTNAQIDSIHEAVLWKYTITSNGATTKELNAAQLADSLATGNYPDAKVDTIKSHGVNDPYIIAGGNQAFWGWITFDVEAGENYWLFQHSSQVGFGGYEFTFEVDPSGIEDVKALANGASDRIYDLSGRRVNSIEAGKLYIKNGKKAIIR